MLFAWLKFPSVKPLFNFSFQVNRVQHKTDAQSFRLKMETYGLKRWQNRVALVTGASSGIGACIAKNLAGHGMIVVGCARNTKSIDEIKEECEKLGYNGKVIPYQCDLGNESEITKMFEHIKSNIGGIDLCINNAGFASNTPLLEIQPSEMREMLNVNVVGLVQCAQLSLKSMFERNVNDGHIFNINSILGHAVLGVFNFYASTKWAVSALTQGFRKELLEKHSRIKVTDISPGRVETHFLHRALGSTAAERIYPTLENLTPQDVTNSLIHALATPPHVQIQDIIIEPIHPTPKGTYDTK